MRQCDTIVRRPWRPLSQGGAFGHLALGAAALDGAFFVRACTESARAYWENIGKVLSA
jgi:hypothetical protein